MTPEPEPANILVVDDTVENLRLLTRLLGQSGFRARPVRSGPEALAAAEEEKPDLVLLDVDMPGMDGYEVCRRLKKMPGFEDMPVIFLSALDQTSDKLQGFSAGAVDFVTKPFHFLEVRVRIESQLELARLRARLLERTNALAESLKRLKEVEQLRHDLVHMAAHDMRSPIMAVGGYLELLAEDALDEATRVEFVARAREGVGTLLRLVDAMLDLSRLEANRMPMRIEERPIVVVLRRALSILGPLASARVICEFPTAEVTVACDEDLLSRVLANLLANALKYSDEPEKVHVRTEPVEPGRVRIVVEDRGPGVPEELRPILFEKFAAGPSSASRGRSTGLGLAFCRLAIEAQGGEIGYLAADAVSGPRFWLALPRSAAPLP